MRLPTAIATVCLGGGLPDKLEAAAAAGFDGVEIFENDLLTFDGSPAEAGRIAEDLGLRIVLFQPFRDFEAMPDAARARNLDRAERKFDVMQALGAELLLVCSNTQASAIDDPARAAADLAAMAERAAARHLRVCYEALAWGRHVNRWAQAWDIVQRAAHPALGLLVDSFHTLALGDDPAGIAQVPADKLFFVQLADAPKPAMDLLSLSRHFRSFPGQGELPVTGFLDAVLASGYRGPLSLEIFNDEFRAAPARRIARDGLRSLVLLQSQMPALPAAALPPPPVSSGIAFVEFALDAASATQLQARMATLGFREAGRHRSKEVGLLREGGVSLILNSEPDSAAAGHFEMHGPAVAALALRVDDVPRAMARAEALLCSSWRERVGEGERAIPALRAPDGMLLYLIGPDLLAPGREFYAQDFDLTPDADRPGRLTGIDHVAQALATGQMDGFVLFWRAVFGLAPEPLVELADPYGIVRSRAMVAADGALRLPLNISESRQTATGRLVSALAGAGVHHIAFATDDAAAAVDAMAARGAPLLPIPENYYEDLAARTGLDDAALEGLRQRGLLYDQDAAGGTFAHAYTEPFEERFFFEVVERRGGYRQFGAANAGVRLAAQARRRRGTAA